MREIRPYGSEGGGDETNRSFLPLSRLSCRAKTWMAGTEAGHDVEGVLT